MMGESVDLGDDPSVPRLVEFLKMAFHPRHFDDVGEILTTREKKWRDETELLKEENGRLRSDKLALEAELKGLKELIAHVNEDRTAIRERERGILEEVHKREADVTELRTEIIELKNNKSKAEAATAQWKKRFEDLEPEMIELKNNKSKAEAAAAQWKKRFEDLEPEMIELKNNKSKAEAAAAQWKKRFEDLEPEMIELKNNKSKAEAATAQWKKRFEDLEPEMIELMNNKSKAEAATAQWKKRFEDLGARISQLESEAELLLRGMGSSILKNIEEGVDGNCTLKKHGKTEAGVFDCNQTPSQVREDSSRDAGSKGDVHCDVVEISDSDNDDCEKTQMNPIKSPHSNRDDTESGGFALKRKSPAENYCTKDNTQSSKQVCLGEMRWHESQLSVERNPKRCRSKLVFGVVQGDSVKSDSSSDSDSDQSIDKCISDVQSCRKWKDQIHMCLAFYEDPELCMDAVCALYRQKIFLKDLTSSKHGVRGCELAEFLIDGDEDGKRRKSKDELMEHDKNGIKDCLNIASISYAQQLFNIFKNQEDPLFP